MLCFERITWGGAFNVGVQLGAVQHNVHLVLAAQHKKHFTQWCVECGLSGEWETKRAGSKCTEQQTRTAVKLYSRDTLGSRLVMLSVCVQRTHTSPTMPCSHSFFFYNSSCDHIT